MVCATSCAAGGFQALYEGQTENRDVAFIAAVQGRISGFSSIRRAVAPLVIGSGSTTRGLASSAG
jgi:hypothetical protein